MECKEKEKDDAGVMSVKDIKTKVPPVPPIVFVPKKEIKMAPTQGGITTGQSNYTDKEVSSVLDKIEDILLIESEKWGKVFKRYD